MESIEPKKSALIRILQILQRESDEKHPLKHDEIVSMLDRDYNITIERKAIGRNIATLNDVGYEIVTTKKGSYLASRQFEDSELKLLIDGVLSSRYITANQSKALIKKLSGLSNRYFRSSIKNVYSVGEWDKTENQDVFYNIECIDEAIQKNKKVSFNYYKYGVDKKLKLTRSHLVSPYVMLFKNQRYYLMTVHDETNTIYNYRLDKISELKIVDEPRVDIKTIDGFQNGIDYKRFSSSLPYMYSDKPQTIEFVTKEEWMINEVVDWFGANFNVEQVEDKYVIRLVASVKAMEYWAMQYLNSVEIVEPKELRDKIKENLQNANEKYKD